MALLPPTMAVLTASNSDFMAKMAESKAAMEDLSTSGTSSFSKLSSVGGAMLAGIAGGAVAVGGVSLKMAADFQEATDQLVTGAGESEKNIGMVRDGILAMAATVGQTPIELAKGMYLIESAGYHGAAGLTVLKAAAEGAATGGAQMATVANAVTTALTDYHLPASQAADVTSALIQTVADGKTHLQDLAGALGKVMPVASALGVSFQEVTGAMATMTNAGLTARFAATHLQNTLLALSAPSATADKALASVGLTSQQVKDTLDGPGGLSAALSLIETHVGSTFPKGSVASVTALKDIMGGVTGYSTALMLSGANAKAFEDDQKNIGGALDRNSQSVQGFNIVQKDLSFQLKQVEAGAEAAAVKIGDWLIPKVETLGHDAADVVVWLGHNKDVLYGIGIVAGTTAAALSTIFVVDKISGWVSKIESAGQSAINFGAKVLGLDAPFASASTAADASATAVTGAAETMQTSMSELTAALEANTAAIQASLGGVGTSAEGAATEFGAAMDTMDADYAATRAELETPITVPPPITAGAGAAGAAEGAGAAGGVGAGAGVAEAGAGVAEGTAIAATAASGLTIAAASVGLAIGVAAAAVIADKIGHLTGISGAGFQQQYLHVAQTQGGAAGQEALVRLDPANLAIIAKGTGPNAAEAQSLIMLAQIHADQAKATDIKALQDNVKTQTQTYGADSKQAASARAQLYQAEHLVSTLGAKDSTLQSKMAGLEAAVQGDQVKLGQLNEKAAALAKDGTMADTKTALASNLNVLHADNAANASGAHIDTGAVKAAIAQEYTHIDALKQVTDEITKAKDTEKMDQDLLGQLKSEQSDIQKLHNDSHDLVTAVQAPRSLAAKGGIRITFVG